MQSANFDFCLIKEMLIFTLSFILNPIFIAHYLPHLIPVNLSRYSHQIVQNILSLHAPSNKVATLPYGVNILRYSLPASKKYSVPFLEIPKLLGELSLLQPSGPSRNPGEPQLPATIFTSLAAMLILFMQWLPLSATNRNSVSPPYNSNKSIYGVNRKFYIDKLPQKTYLEHSLIVQIKHPYYYIEHVLLTKRPNFWLWSLALRAGEGVRKQAREEGELNSAFWTEPTIFPAVPQFPANCSTFPVALSYAQMQCQASCAKQRAPASQEASTAKWYQSYTILAFLSAGTVKQL